MRILAVLSMILCTYQFSGAQCTFDPTVDGELILCPNSTSTLSTQEYDAYQWYRREFSEPTSSAIQGDTLQTISVSNPGDVLYYYSVAATLDGCTELSPEVLIDGWAFLPVTVSSTGDFDIGNNGESIVCIGDTMYFTLNLPYDTNITWFKDGSPIPGDTSTVLTVTTEGQYTVFAAPGICPSFVQSLGLNLDVIFIECPTRVEEGLPSGERVLIYPNPASNQITIQGKGGKILDVNIYNSIGRLIRTEMVAGRELTMDVSS